MSKAALHFDLSDDGDRELFDLASAILAKPYISADQVRHAADMYCLLVDIDQMLRARAKYDENVTDAEHDLIDKVRGLIAETGFHEWCE